MIAKVRLWGRTIGAVSLDDERDVAAFQYDADFARSGIELSPLAMPLSERVYEFPALPRNTRRHLTQRPALDRRALIEADILDCMVTLPGQLFYNTQIPVCLWFSGKNEPAGKTRAVSKLELALAA